MSHFSLLQLVLSGIEGGIFACHQDLWIGRLNDRNLGFRGEILNRWQGWQKERKYHLVGTSFYSWVCVRKGYDNGREIGEFKVDLRSLIFNLEDFFGGFSVFMCIIVGNWWLDFELLSWFLRFRIWYEFIKILRCINPAMLCLVMHSAGGILVWLSCIMNRGDIRCTQEHDGDDPFYIREFHISMRHYV